VAAREIPRKRADLVVQWFSRFRMMHLKGVVVFGLAA
jgi:hypothetical protein